MTRRGLLARSSGLSRQLVVLSRGVRAVNRETRVVTTFSIKLGRSALVKRGRRPVQTIKPSKAKAAEARSSVPWADAPASPGLLVVAIGSKPGAACAAVPPLAAGGLACGFRLSGSLGRVR